MLRMSLSLFKARHFGWGGINSIPTALPNHRSTCGTR